MVKLSNRERQLMDYLAKGYPAKQIGAALFISTDTAQNHIKSIRRKMNAVSNVDAVVRFIAAQKDPAAYVRKIVTVGLLLIVQGASIAPDMEMRRNRVQRSRQFRISRTLKTAHS